MKRVMLTIDVDYFPGIDQGVEKLIDALDEWNVKSTFFITGRFAEDYPDITKKLVQKGHEVGCHGYSHGIDWDENFFNLNLHAQVEKIAIATQIIERTIGLKIKIFRAPYLKANSNTIRALESLGYDCDSSVASLRFDFGLGLSNNPRALIAPTKPYNPSSQDIFRMGHSNILEIPTSNFIVPLSTSSLRMFGWKSLLRVYRLSLLYFDPVVIIAHPWEFMDVDELNMKENLPKRHKKNRGRKCLILLQNFLDKIHEQTEYISFEQIIKEKGNV